MGLTKRSCEVRPDTAGYPGTDSIEEDDERYQTDKQDWRQCEYRPSYGGEYGQQCHRRATGYVGSINGEGGLVVCRECGRWAADTPGTRWTKL